MDPSSHLKIGFTVVMATLLTAFKTPADVPPLMPAITVSGANLKTLPHDPDKMEQGPFLVSISHSRMDSPLRFHVRDFASASAAIVAHMTINHTRAAIDITINSKSGIMTMICKRKMTEDYGTVECTDIKAVRTSGPTTGAGRPNFSRLAQ